MAMEWTLAPFHALRPADIHAVFALRSNVFIVEQRCPYPDVDDLDLDALHLLGNKPDMGLVAYARIIPPTGDEVPHIGRVVVRADHRGQGLGHELLRVVLDHLQHRFGSPRCALAAQQHLQAFYEQHGFRTTSDAYDLDGIPHVDMVHTGAPST